MQLKSEIQPVMRVLANQRYGLDVYQRGYVWSERELAQFLTDLEDYTIDWASEPNPAPWFLGSAIIERRGAENYLVDGQQRLVTMGLLLLALHPNCDRSVRKDVELALSGDRGLKLPLAVRRYQDVFSALAKDGADTPDPDWDSDQRRIAEAFMRIRDWVNSADRSETADEIANGVLRRCLLNVVTVTETELAYRLFNSLNARGKPLSTVEALKGVLFANLGENDRAALSERWDAARSEAESKPGAGVNATLDALRAAITARHADADIFTDPARKNELRRLRENPFEWLARAEDSGLFMDRIGAELPFDLRVFARAEAAARRPTPGAEALHFVSACGIDAESWAPVLLAALEPRYGDPDENARKASAVIAFLDIVAARTAWRPGQWSPAAIRDKLSQAAPALRGLQTEELAYRLGMFLQEHFDAPFEPHERLYVGPGGISESVTHALLARLAAQVELFASPPMGDYTTFVDDKASGYGLMTLTIAQENAGKATASGHHPLGATVLAPVEMAEDYADAPFSAQAEALKNAANTMALLVSSAAPDDPFLNTSLSGVGADLALDESGLTSEKVETRQASYAALAHEIWRDFAIMEAAGNPSPRLVKLLSFDRTD